MKRLYTRLLRDDELRLRLESGDTIVFHDLSREWENIERQVDRLGYGSLYATSRFRRSGTSSQQDVVRVSPIRAPQEED
jgi:hypothetical protein